MLLASSNARGTRVTNRSRGRGGRVATRGASNSSSKFIDVSSIPKGSRALRDTCLVQGFSNYRGRNYDANFKNRGLSFKYTDTPHIAHPDTTNSFEKQRLENAAKREQRGQKGTEVNGWGGRVDGRGQYKNKQVRFDQIPTSTGEQDASSHPTYTDKTMSNPFASSATTPSIFGVPASSAFNPFAPKPQTDTPNPFQTSTPPSNPFGAPSQNAATSNPFSKPSPGATQSTASSVFGVPSVAAQSNPFAPSASSANGISDPTSTRPSSWNQSGASHIPPSTAVPFGAPSTPNGTSSFLQTSTLKPARKISSTPGNTSFGSASSVTSKPLASTIFPGTSAKTQLASGPPSTSFSAGSASLSGTLFGQPSKPSTLNNSNLTPNSKRLSNVGFSAMSAQNPSPLCKPSSVSETASSIVHAQKVDQLLRKDGIRAPAWPKDPGNPRQKAAVEAFWHSLKEYQGKVRKLLISGGLLDDPDKPKKLSEAIDFKGTCEDMCPELEKATRIMESNVAAPEKGVAPNGSGESWPDPLKMVKAHARSAAGQDAPLPMDIRSPAALRRTLDYLFNTVLGDTGDLSKVHGFLWDRTRAIRRDFVFQSSMSPSELSDFVYCLENIARFHVTSLHQMSREDDFAVTFSEQQENEQLAKTLLSLIHTYEDCQAQDIICENEAEFRAYYLLLNSHNTGIMETVQDWGWKFWGESREIKIAISLVEAIQNNWDVQGPLRPELPTDVAQNAFSRFFSIVADRSVSYTMACFAEIHFNSVRKSALKTILASYRKQRDQTRDWSIGKLNHLLRFDDEADIISFGESYGLQFDEFAGENYLSFESDDAISDPFPRLKQPHTSLVERKRGNHPLPSVFRATVYDESEVSASVETAGDADEEDGLFVKDTIMAPTQAQATPSVTVSVDLIDQNISSVEEGQGKISKPGFGIQSPQVEEKATLPSISPDLNSHPAFGNNFSSVSNQKPASDMKTTTSLDSQQSLGLNFFSLEPAGNPASHEKTLPSSFAFPPTATGTPKPPSIFDKPSSSEVGNGPSPMFNFAQPSKITAPSERSNLSATSGSHSVTQHSPPTQPSVFGGNNADAVKNPTEAIKPSAVPTAVSQGPLFPPLASQASSISAVTQQQSTLPLSQPDTYSGSSFSSFPGNQSSVATGEEIKPPQVKDKSLLETFAAWFASGNEGLVDEFVEYQVDSIVSQAMSIYKEEEMARLAREAEETAREEAAMFRYKFIATKYCHKWRSIARYLWMRRRGREGRQARREMAESHRAAKTAQSQNLVEDFRASTVRSRASLESMLDATGVLNGVHSSRDGGQAIERSEEPPPELTRQHSERSAKSATPSSNPRHKRIKSDAPHRRSLLSDSSYLAGGSKIQHLSHSGLKQNPQASGVHTDYFRLKARGITTLPNGAPLANTAANQVPQDLATPVHFKRPSTSRSASAIPKSNSNFRGSLDWGDEIHALKSRARAIMAEGRDAPAGSRKRSFESDEDLFERAKKLKEQMNESTARFRKGRDSIGDNFSRSLS